jgi:hypothetical protein
VEPQHLGQRHQPEQDDLAADDAGGGGHEHRGYEGHRADAAGQAARPHAHRIVQLARHARAVHDRRHQQEHRHRQQDVDVDEAIDPAGDQLDRAPAEERPGEGDRDEAERKCERHPE